jgi:hypothetical protein
MDGAPSQDAVPAAAAAGRQRCQMRLQHAGDVDRDACQVSGPYDVVLMDMALSRLLHALLKVRQSLRQGLYLGWVFCVRGFCLRAVNS